MRFTPVDERLSTIGINVKYFITPLLYISAYKRCHDVKIVLGDFTIGSAKYVLATQWSENFAAMAKHPHTC